MFEEFLLPNGKVATSVSDVDVFLKESGLTLAGDWSSECVQSIRRKNQEAQRKEAFEDFILTYKKRIWNE